MIETANPRAITQLDETTLAELRLQILFTRLFLDKAVSFFDAEPDEEFINVFDHVDSFPVHERRKALEEFRRELRLEENYAGEYGRMSEVLIQSEDFLDNIEVPFLLFNLTCDEDRKDPANLFRLDLFEVFCIGKDQFLVVLYVRNAHNSHMEMYMRFARCQAVHVVRAILRVFEDYMGYTEGELPASCVAESEIEEILMDRMGGADSAQLKDSREATEAKLREFRFGN